MLIDGSYAIFQMFISEAIVRRCFIKRCSSKIRKIHRKTLLAESLQPQACNFIKKETLTQVFPLNFAKFLRTPFLQNTSDGCFCHICLSSISKKPFQILPGIIPYMEVLIKIKLKTQKPIKIMNLLQFNRIQIDISMGIPIIISNKFNNKFKQFDYLFYLQEYV